MPKCDILEQNRGEECLVNLHHLRYFVTLAHMRHYTRAAQALSITQPSLSHAISLMEEELGVPLFAKSGRGVALTRSGEEFLEHTERALQTLDEGVAAVRRSADDANRIRLGFIAPLGVEFVPRLAAGFQKRRAGDPPRFSFRTDLTSRLLEGLAAGEYDVVFCARSPGGAQFAAAPVYRQKWALIAPPGHPLANRPSADLREIARYPQICFPEGSLQREFTDQRFAKAGAKPEIAHEAPSEALIAGLVRQGFGVAMVPCSEAPLPAGVAVVPVRAPGCERLFYMVRGRRALEPSAVRAFCRYAEECAAEEMEQRDEALAAAAR